MDEATKALKSVLDKNTAKSLTMTASESVAADNRAMGELLSVAKDSGPQHTAEGITSVISTLQSLAETLPGVVHAANNSSGQGLRATPFRSTAALENAAEMLRQYRDGIERTQRARSSDERRSLLNDEWENGHRVGIEEENRRAREARRGRKH